MLTARRQRRMLGLHTMCTRKWGQFVPHVPQHPRVVCMRLQARIPRRQQRLSGCVGAGVVVVELGLTYVGAYADINECTGNHKCPADTQCVNRPGYYTCEKAGCQTYNPLFVAAGVHICIGGSSVGTCAKPDGYRWDWERKACIRMCLIYYILIESSCAHFRL